MSDNFDQVTMTNVWWLLSSSTTSGFRGLVEKPRSNTMIIIKVWNIVLQAQKEYLKHKMRLRFKEPNFLEQTSAFWITKAQTQTQSFQSKIRLSWNYWMLVKTQIISSATRKILNTVYKTISCKKHLINISSRI